MNLPAPAVPEYAELAPLLADTDALVRAVAGGVLRGHEAPAQERVDVRVVDLRAGRALQVQGFDATQAHTTNHPADQPEALQLAIADLLARPYGHWHVETTQGTVAVRVTKKGKALVQRDRRAPATPVDRSHDRVKSRRLEAGDPVFAALGVTTADGQVKPTRRDKFTQVQDFLQAMQPVLAPAIRAAGDGPLRIVDLGCGNAYLSFAAYQYLTQVHGLDVHLTGIDSKAQSREHNTAVAAKIGASDHVDFIQGRIGEADPSGPAHLVMALHACDTATDDALAQAVRWQAPVVLAAPCCHHDIQRQLGEVDRDGLAPEDALLTQHGILSERLADVLTDSFRAELLRAHGYRAEVMEFVDTQHTRRNALIRAVRVAGSGERDAGEGYRALRDRWSVTPRLEQLLADSSLADTAVTLQ